MAAPSTVDGIVPIGEFKTHIAKMARQLHETQRPIVVTQNGRSTMVVLTPEEYERLTYHEWARALIERRLRESEDVTSAECLDHDEFMQQLEDEFSDDGG